MSTLLRQKLVEDLQLRGLSNRTQEMYVLAVRQLGRVNIRNAVFSVAFSPDNKIAYAASMDGKLIEWHITEKPLSELLDWIKENRYANELTEAEKFQYHVEP